jgi:hypothetical protein
MSMSLYPALEGKQVTSLEEQVELVHTLLVNEVRALSASIGESPRIKAFGEGAML